jgi:hypothetical protein
MSRWNITFVVMESIVCFFVLDSASLYGVIVLALLYLFAPN